jgi:hypothetical protein
MGRGDTRQHDAVHGARIGRLNLGLITTSLIYMKGFDKQVFEGDFG